jgi:murein L,D-transpeptidase YafK
MRHRFLTFNTICLFVLTSCGSGVSQVSEHTDKIREEPSHERSLINAEIPLSLLMDSLKLDKRKCFIRVDKSDLVLQFVHLDDIIKEYPVVLGGNPVDDKLREGDQCTPEGEFKIKSMYPHRSWSYFVWFDYPNQSSWQKHNQAKNQGAIPKNVSIGGEVGIHGVPEGRDDLIEERIHLTLGCIALKTEHIGEIYKFAFAGMRVIITP